MSQSAAYKEAYVCVTKNINNIASNACRLSKKTNIKARIEELMAKEKNKPLYSLEESFKKLVELQDKAISDGNINAAIRIEVLKGKMTGIYDKKAINKDNYVREIKVNYIRAKKDNKDDYPSTINQ